MSQTVLLENRGSIAVIGIDNPPVNALSQSVRSGLVEHVNKASSDPLIKAIVLICKGRTFIAGADIREFGKPPQAPYLPDVLEILDQCPVPIIAALHGTALGGGLETALACRYRIADASAMVGLPEVHLGLIPGAGGTQRLPRIAGLENALDMITSGRHVSAAEAMQMGLVDRLSDTPDLLEAAIAFTSEILDSGDARPRVSDIDMQDSAANRKVLDTWKHRVKHKARGQQSPMVAVESITNTLNLSFADGLARERELFTACLSSEQSRALRHIFFAERASAKLPSEITGQAIAIKNVTVIGGGTMGRGIAMCLANAGIAVRIIETNQENLEQSLQLIEQSYAKMQASGRIDETQKQQRMSLIGGSCDYASLGDDDLVIEAAFEDMAVKRDIFGLLDQYCRADAILATNTSYLDIESIAGAVKDPSRVIGMHFFGPAHIMKLLEVIRTSHTSGAAIATAMRLGKQLGKRCVLARNGFGFAANRMYSAYQRQGQQMLLEGVTPAQLDQAMKKWGMAMGPAAVMDLSGIDIGYKARRQNPSPPDDPCFFRPADLLVEHGFLGRKSGRGFYRYDPETGEASEDPEVLDLIRQEAKRLGVIQRDLSETDIQNNMINAIALEGRKILADGIARQASDLDVIWVNGYGFPRWRGGPMFMAERVK